MTATAEPSGAGAHKKRTSDLAPKYACGVAAPQALRSGRAKRLRERKAQAWLRGAGRVHRATLGRVSLRRC